jgi:hypothetical protein
VFPEDFIVQHSHNVVLVVRILLVEIFKNLQLNASLVLKPRLFPNDFNCNHHFGLMVKTLYCLSKRSTAQRVQRLIAKVARVRRGSMDLLGLTPDEINLLVILDLYCFKIGQTILL